MGAGIEKARSSTYGAVCKADDLDAIRNGGARISSGAIGVAEGRHENGAS